MKGLASLLAFNTGVAASLKDILANRDAALLQYQKASTALDARSSERQKWQATQSAQQQARRAHQRSLVWIGVDQCCSVLFSVNQSGQQQAQSQAW